MAHLENPALDFWSGASFETTLTMSNGADRRLAFFDVRFDPDGIAAMMPRKPSKVLDNPSADTNAAPKHAGGRPPWSGWEDLWAEIGAQLYCGDLKPTKQADIEDAMLLISESTGGPQIAAIRERARKVWSLIKQKG